jgi:hypothetical protein
MANPNARRNLYAVRDDDDDEDAPDYQQQSQHAAEGDELFNSSRPPSSPGNLHEGNDENAPCNSNHRKTE